MENNYSKDLHKVIQIDELRLRTILENLFEVP